MSITRKSGNINDNILYIEKIQRANPNKVIISSPQSKNVITTREFDIVDICNNMPNDMELGKTIREYINANFKKQSEQ